MKLKPAAACLCNNIDNMKINHTTTTTIFAATLGLAGMALHASAASIIHEFTWTGPTIAAGGPVTNPGTYMMTGWFSYPEGSAGPINGTMLEDLYISVSYGSQMIGTRQLSLNPIGVNENLIFNFDPASGTFISSGGIGSITSSQAWFTPISGTGATVGFVGYNNSQGLHVPAGSFTNAFGFPTPSGYPVNSFLSGDGFVVTLIPEPSTALLCIGGMVLFRRRRRAQ
jgi:hypothetical protein